jgi:acylphosphatase
MFESKIIVHGRVQGVGYRASIISFIDNQYMDLKGYVKNLSNGSVEIVAQGSKEDLIELRKFSSVGSTFCRVDSIEEVCQPIDSYTYDSFEVVYE